MHLDIRNAAHKCKIFTRFALFGYSVHLGFNGKCIFFSLSFVYSPCAGQSGQMYFNHFQRIFIGNVICFSFHCAFESDSKLCDFFRPPHQYYYYYYFFMHYKRVLILFVIVFVKCENEGRDTDRNADYFQFIKVHKYLYYVFLFTLALIRSQS